MSEVIGLDPGAKVVDVGTGNNTLPIYWACQGMEVTLTDPDEFLFNLQSVSEQMVRSGQLEEGKVRFEKADGAQLPFEDETFDYWTSISVVEHIPGDGDSQVLQEAARVLKPGGLAVLTTEGGMNMHERWIRVDGHFGKQYDEVGDEASTGASYALLREYNRRLLFERLVEPSGMEVVEYGFIDKRWRTNYRELVETPSPSWWAASLREVIPWLCLWSYRRVEDPERTSPNPGATAYLILRKPVADESR